MESTRETTREKAKKLPEFNIEDFNLRPAGRGLGFHHESKLSQGQPRRRNEVPKEHSFHTSPIFEESRKASASKKTIRKKIRMPSSELQFIAWAIDLIVISLFCGVFAFSFCLVAGVDLPAAYAMAREPGILIYLAAMVAILYVAYFTYADLDTSLGKRLCGMRMIPSAGSKLGADATFIRAIITLCSLPLCGIPTLFDFQGKLSDTIVAKK